MYNTEDSSLTELKVAYLGSKARKEFVILKNGIPIRHKFRAMKTMNYDDANLSAGVRLSGRRKYQKLCLETIIE